MDCIIYPFSDTSLVAAKQLIKDGKYTIKKLVTPKTWMKITNDECIDGGKFNFGNNIGAFVTNDFENAVHECETIIIVDSRYSKVMKKDLIKKMTYVIENKKNIICCIVLDDEEIHYLETLCKKNQVSFSYLLKDYKELDIGTPKLYKPDATVIGVGKIISRLDSGFTLIGYAEEYKKAGYKTIVITNNNNLSLLDFFVYPSQLFDSTLSECEKIIYFNKFIKWIDNEYVPDIIIIDMPDAMMRYSNVIHNGFGVMPYIISQAIDIDYFILVSHIDMLDANFYKEISNCFKYRFGYEIDAITIMNMIIDLAHSNEKTKPVCNYVPVHVVEQYISESFKNQNISVYNPQNELSWREMALESIDKLSKYSNAI